MRTLILFVGVLVVVFVVVVFIAVVFMVIVSVAVVFVAVVVDIMSKTCAHVCQRGGHCEHCAH